MSIDPANSCRICMISDCNLTCIFEEHDGKPINEIISEISGVIIEKDDMLSQNICEECKIKTLELFAFRQLCIDSDETMRYNLLLAEQSENASEEDLSPIASKHHDTPGEEMEEFFIDDEDEPSQFNGSSEQREYDKLFMENEVEDDDSQTIQDSIEEVPEDDGKLNKKDDGTNMKESQSVTIERVGSIMYVKDNIIFQSNEELTQKMREAHYAKETLKRHKCPYCEKCFLFPSKVSRHVQAVHKDLSVVKKTTKKNHLCPVCGKAFVSQFKVRRHMIVHDTELKTGLQKNWSRNYFVCTDCNRKFHTETTFKRHELVCDMLQKSLIQWSEDHDFFCVICSHIFKSNDEMIEHMKKHDSNSVHTCVACPEVTLSHTDMIRHGKYHEENAIYRCCACQKLFPNGEEIVKHLLRNHKDYKPWQCLTCEKGFFDKFKLKQHEMTHDPSSAKQYLCEYCDHRPFAQLDYLNCHIRRKHSGSKPYCCSYCPKQFVFQHDLKIHLTTHNGDKKHICKICQASFTKAWSLKQHLTLHETPASPISCQICDFIGNSKRELRSHMDSHDNIKDFNLCFIESGAEDQSEVDTFGLVEIPGSY